MAYRPEIDGLRAIAVLSVIIYHAFPQSLPGGFTGVDIFFVISGYLITQIILRERARGDFSYADFYTRRAKRILPAAWAVIVFSTIVATLLFSPASYLSFYWSAVSSIGFVANHYFASNFGYFNGPGDHTLLLHFWTLSVEEQFYLVWPALLLIIAKVRLAASWKLLILCCFALLSFFGAQLMAGTGRFANDGFYLLPPRSGELLVGCILAIYQNSTSKPVQSTLVGWLGLSMILASLVFISSDLTFPGLYALLPCLGAALVLCRAEARAISIQTLLSARAMVYVGKISYSLYLWHWPLLVIPSYLFGVVSSTVKIMLLASSFVLAHLSWAHIEGPVRRSSLSFRQALMWLFVAPALLVIALAGVRVVVDQRYDKLPALLSSTNYPAFCYRSGKSDQCKIGDLSRESSVLLFGDSHAGHFRPYWNAVGKRLGIAVDAYAAQTCYPLVSMGGVEPAKDPNIKDKVNCIPHLKLMDEIAQDYQTIVLAAGWVIYKTTGRGPVSFDFSTQLEQQIRHWSKSGKRIIVMAQVPWFLNKSVESHRNSAQIPVESIRRWAQAVNVANGFTTQPDVDAVNLELRSLTQRYPGVYFLDAMANTHLRLASPYFRQQMLYVNGDHLSVFGAQLLASLESDERLRELLALTQGR